MKKLIDYKDEIHKCSKCGLCQSVCPVYEQTGNDCTVSRGKFIMLNGIIKGDLKLNKNINKYLDMCLKCNACKDFCPSGIDARKIFLAAKGEYFEKARNSGLYKVLNCAPVFNLFLNCAKLASTTYRFLKFDKLAKAFYPILTKFELGKKAILANQFLESTPIKTQSLKPMPFTCVNCMPQNSKKMKQPNESKLNLNIVYFKGCVNEYINPRAKIAGKNVLNQMGVNILPLDFQCCGVPFLSSGNQEQFKKQAEFNLNQIPDEFDFFLTDCASCQNAFAEYENYIEDEKMLEKLRKINEKSINIVDFIVKNVNSFEFDKKTNFTFHKPCHLEDLTFLQEFLNKAKNVEYIEMNEFDKCCGFSGEFAIKNIKLSEKISAKKAQNAIDTNADYIITSCPACVLGLTQGMVEVNEFKPTLNFIEFLAQSKIS